MNGPATSSPNRFAPVLSLALIVAALYFARDFLLPLALAVLISFLLAPLIRGLERWHFGRVLSVITATVLAFSLIGLIGFVLAGQMIDLANKLPEYKTNLRAKITAFKTSPNGALSKAKQTVEDLSHEISDPAPEATPPVQGVKPKAPPVPVSVVYSTGNAFQMLKDFVAPVLAPLGTAAVVIVFVIFILLEREDLRDRVIHLVGRRHLQVTTQALDEAGHRVSRYLLAQFIVNVSYGIPIAAGLHFIGIPNAVLWGVLGAMLRFVPYVGAWISACFPIALSLAVSPSWTMPLLTLGLFAVVELITNNVIEPWLYGSSTGLSPMAIIVAAVFWTWLWGGVGLLLATPLTVCIAVLGKYIPSLTFLDVLLGETPPIAAEDRFYQRLLASDNEEALTLAEEYLAKNGAAATCDEVIVPTLRRAELDARTAALPDEFRREIMRNMNLVLTELMESSVVPPGEAERAQVYCVPVSNETDEIGARLLGRLLAEHGIAVCVLSSKLMTAEMIDAVAEAAPPVVCVSALSAQSLIAAAHLCQRLRVRLPSAVLMVGLWGEIGGENERRLQRFKKAQADYVFATLADAVNEVRHQPQLTAAIVPPDVKAA